MLEIEATHLNVLEKELWQLLTGTRMPPRYSWRLIYELAIACLYVYWNVPFLNM